ncbi:hypothetical protein BKA65DRAFT_504063 [Rhexocercosporidium sp. MPI-PUGE-AT-0058]|nr:hypothetical protein BKA65DRAFT_504063 [Rhexocercosporidium sp. MPI-PUGE-AT-0058]
MIIPLAVSAWTVSRVQHVITLFCVSCLVSWMALYRFHIFSASKAKHSWIPWYSSSSATLSREYTESQEKHMTYPQQ